MKKWIILTIFFFLPSLTWAEIVKLKNGKVIQGKIVEETEDSVTIMSGGIQITYFSEEIEEMTQDKSVIKDYRKKQKEESDARIEYFKKLDKSLRKKRGSRSLSGKERMKIIEQKMEKKYGDREAVEIDHNDRLAHNLLRMLSQSAENYATFNEGVYPARMTDLTEADPPYLTSSLCGKTKEGFMYNCDLSVNGYTFTATPEIPGKTGSRPFTIKTKENRNY